MKMKRRVSVAAIYAAAAAAMLTSTSAFAAIVCNTTPISVPSNISGVYLNLVTGVTGTSDATVPGWDANPYNNKAGLTFFSPDDGSGLVGNSTEPPDGGTAAVVASGTEIGPASSYTGAFQTSGINFQVGGTLFAGIRFVNEATATTNYGWLELTTTATDGFPATINRYCYQNDGTSIVAGTVPVQLQSYSID